MTVDLINKDTKSIFHTIQNVQTVETAYGKSLDCLIYRLTTYVGEVVYEIPCVNTEIKVRI